MIYVVQDPFLRISRLSENPIAIPLCETEVISNNLNPVWRPIALTSQQYGSKASTVIFLAGAKLVLILRK